jgi:hypothetical protein
LRTQAASDLAHASLFPLKELKNTFNALCPKLANWKAKNKTAFLTSNQLVLNLEISSIGVAYKLKLVSKCTRKRSVVKIVELINTPGSE